MSTSAQFTVLSEMKKALGPEKADNLFIERMRQLSVWAQVQAFMQDYNVENEKPYVEMQKITKLYPEIMPLMSRFVEVSAKAYRNSKAAGSFVDKTGANFLAWCCKSFGQTMR